MSESIFEYPLILAPQLVPASAWGQNLRAVLSAKEWQAVRLSAFEKYGKKCQFCSAKPKVLDCHEIWQYVKTDDTAFQRLLAVKPLCKNCHAVCHIGFWSLQGPEVYERIKAHFIRVRKIPSVEADKIISDAFRQHNELSKIQWILDVDLQNITI